MKKLLITILFFASLFGCTKEIGDLSLSKTIPGGCFVDNGITGKNSLTTDIDTVSYSIENGILNIFVGFNATCCGEYSTSSQINGDIIVIKILTTKVGDCNCICYYTYNFIFNGSGKKYEYIVTVDDYLKFTGEIKP